MGAADVDNLEIEGSVLGGNESLRSGSRRAGHGMNRAENQPEWDASTACSDAVPMSERSGGASELAKDILAGNPQMRGVHSKGSMQRLIEKAAAAKAGSPDED